MCVCACSSRSCATAACGVRVSDGAWGEHPARASVRVCRGGMGWGRGKKRVPTRTRPAFQYTYTHRVFRDTSESGCSHGRHGVLAHVARSSRQHKAVYTLQANDESHMYTCIYIYIEQTHTYVPLQTREHAWAGMSGMPHFGGARGAFTSRGAEP